MGAFLPFSVLARGMNDTNPAQANTIKFYNFAPSTAQKLNKRLMQFWFTGIVFSIMHGLLKVCAKHLVLLIDVLNGHDLGRPALKRSEEAAKPNMGGEECGDGANPQAPRPSGRTRGLALPVHHRRFGCLDPCYEHRFGEFQRRHPWYLRVSLAPTHIVK